MTTYHYNKNSDEKANEINEIDEIEKEIMMENNKSGK
jgi:hypothetical protein